MKVLVVGGSGFLGEHLCTLLIEKGYEVINVDVKSSSIRHDRFTTKLVDANRLKTTFGAEVVINCAALVPLTRSKKGFKSSNLHACRNMLEVSRRNGVKHFIFVSSSAVYGVPFRNPVKIDDEKNPFESYGRSKLAAEKLCLDFRGGDMLVSIARPRTIAGAGRKGVFAILFELVIQDRRIPLFRGGSNRFQFVHVSDVAEPIELICKLNKEVDINLGSLDYPTLRDSLSSLVRYANSKSSFVRFPTILLKFVSLLSHLRILPFAPYQLKMYDKDFYFQADLGINSLGWRPKFTSTEALFSSFNAYVSCTSPSTSGSAHQLGVNSKLLRLVMRLL